MKSPSVFSAPTLICKSKLTTLNEWVIRGKLAALASLYEYLFDTNAVTDNPVKGGRRLKVDSYEGKIPALGDAQARQLLDAPPADTLKGKRDRASLSVLLCKAKEASCVTSRPTPTPFGGSVSTWKRRAMARIRKDRCFAPSSTRVRDTPLRL